MKDKVVIGALFCLVAGGAWGAQFPIAGRALRLIDPFYFTVLRYVAVSVILVVLLLYRTETTWPGLLIVLSGIPVYLLWRGGPRSARP